MNENTLQEKHSHADFNYTPQNDTLYCQGYWTLDHLTELENRLKKLTFPKSKKIFINGQHLHQLDTAGAWFLYHYYQQWSAAGYHVELQSFNPAYQNLLNRVLTHSQDNAVFTPPPAPSVLETMGRYAHNQWQQITAFLSFIGETATTFFQVLWFPWRIRWKALFSNIYASGVTALPIVGLMAFLVGIVLAYQGGTQLKQYGANIFIVDLVGITLLRELAPMLTAVIVAGRSGSAYTAQIGTMKVSEEIDALRTIGIAPMELLVLPKLLALIIVLPLLSAFADLIGILGSLLIAKVALDVSILDFMERFPQAVGLNHYLIGIGKAPVFAAIIVLVGCFQGFQVRGGADSVGQQTTVSVVQAIFLVIVADAIFSILFNFIGI